MNTPHKYSNLVTCIALTIFAAAVSCRANAPAAAAPGGGAASGAAQDLLNRLNSANAAERDAAQKQAAVFFDLLVKPEALQKFSDAAPDDDVKDFLRDRVAKLKSREEARRMANLPPISLNVKNASLQEVVDTLNKSVNSGLSFESVTDAGFADRFNLTVTDQPFWEVFAALYRQHPLTLTGTAGAVPGLRVSTARTNFTAYTIEGPAIGFVNNISLQRSTGGDSDASGRKSTLNVGCVVAFDPRLSIARLQAATIANAVDDRGQAYPLPSSGESTFIGNNMMLAQARTYTLVAPAEMGKKLSFALDTSADINVVSGVTTIGDIEHNVNKLVVLGNRTYRVSRFEPVAAPAVRAGTPTATAPARFNITIVSGDAPSTQPATTPAAAPGVPANNPSIQYLIMDATGKPVWRGTGSGGGAMNTTLTGTNGPYKLEIRTFSGTAALLVHLQFKDISLP